jgi:NAD(P)-dependent dehydrogenase (short-subunit alcohol dehydrogenase family)
VHDQIIKTIPAGRLAEISDVVEPVLFLCSGGADFITGQVLSVSGGLTMHG